MLSASLTNVLFNKFDFQLVNFRPFRWEGGGNFNSLDEKHEA